MTLTLPNFSATKKSILSFVAKHRLEVYAALAITLLALSLRLYRIDEYMTFLGDEGRDVRIVREILRGDPAFIGPQTSIGNMYLGPLYYYMMAPALWLSGLDPVGPAVMIAFLGAVTVLFTWWVGRTWFGPKAGLVASLLLALSPVAIILAARVGIQTRCRFLPCFVSGVFGRSTSLATGAGLWLLVLVWLSPSRCTIWGFF